MAARTIATALEQRLAPLCWHIEHNEHGSAATGYVTLTRLQEADTIRAAWAQQLGLDSEQGNGYVGRIAGLSIATPDVIDLDEHCHLCDHPFDVRNDGPTARDDGGDVCSSCATQ